jgi:hypothetical protein
LPHFKLIIATLQFHSALFFLNSALFFYIPLYIYPKKGDKILFKNGDIFKLTFEGNSLIVRLTLTMDALSVQLIIDF